MTTTNNKGADCDLITLRNDGEDFVIVELNGKEIIREFYASGETEMNHTYHYRPQTRSDAGDEFVYFWARPWDGDDSDIGQFITECTADKSPPDDNPNWFRLHPEQPARGNVPDGVTLTGEDFQNDIKTIRAAIDLREPEDMDKLDQRAITALGRIEGYLRETKNLVPQNEEETGDKL